MISPSWLIFLRWCITSLLLLLRFHWLILLLIIIYFHYLLIRVIDAIYFLSERHDSMPLIRLLRHYWAYAIISFIFDALPPLLFTPLFAEICLLITLYYYYYLRHAIIFWWLPPYLFSFIFAINIDIDTLLAIELLLLFSWCYAITLMIIDYASAIITLW